MSWLKRLAEKLNKTAIDKLPEDELDSGLPDPAADPSGMGMDPSMLMPPPVAEEPKPLVWNNKYLVRTNGPEFIVELTPSIVSDPNANSAGMPAASGQPMADTTLNPNADPEQLQQWMKESDDNDKPYSNNDAGTVDPLSKQDEGIEDTGNEQSVKVHNKKKVALLKKAEDEIAGQDSSPTALTPGADRSNAYPPCKYCANFNAAENTCSQGLDVEKVQAAKSCSWLNSNMTPFNGEKEPDASHKDKDTVVSDVSELAGGGEAMQGGSMGASASLKYDRKDKQLKSYLDKMWD